MSYSFNLSRKDSTGFCSIECSEFDIFLELHPERYLGVHVYIIDSVITIDLLLRF